MRVPCHILPFMQREDARHSHLTGTAQFATLEREEGFFDALLNRPRVYKTHGWTPAYREGYAAGLNNTKEKS